MIAPMRHATLICRGEDAGALLERLRDFGAVHLNFFHRDNHHIETLAKRLNDTEQVVKRLERIEQPAGESPADDPAELVDICDCIDHETRDIRQLEAVLLRESRVWEPFGEVKPEILRDLRRRGLGVEFYRAAQSPADLPPDTAWLTAAPGFGVAVSVEPLDAVSTEPMRLPVRGPERLRQLDARLRDLKRRQDEVLAGAATALPSLRTYRDGLADQLDFLKAREGMDAEDSLRWIEGFVPEDADDGLRDLAAEWGAAVSFREPAEEDPTPTLLKQNAFVSWIQPVFSFLGVTPGYNEVDVGWSFLVFLSLFSGMIIGDAGYGAILLLVVGLLNLRKPASRGKFANLLYLMGGATVFWGLLTGNVFGIQNLPPALEAVKIPALADTKNPKAIMNVCFLMGALHLTLAHGWNLWRNRTSLKALAELGWIGSTWTMYGLTGVMVLGWESLPAFVVPAFVASVALIVLFMTPPAKFKEQWVNHMMLPLSFVNNFVDVVSYVRLYAVGMATFALASSFNTMIFPEGAERGVLGTGVMLVILILGHALNFILAGMGVMVHGIRLNTLEFASHLGLTWSGIPYAPFKRRGQSSEGRGQEVER